MPCDLVVVRGIMFRHMLIKDFSSIEYASSYSISSMKLFLNFCNGLTTSLIKAFKNHFEVL